MDCSNGKNIKLPIFNLNYSCPVKLWFEGDWSGNGKGNFCIIY